VKRLKRIEIFQPRRFGNLRYSRFRNLRYFGGGFVALDHSCPSVVDSLFNCMDQISQARRADVSKFLLNTAALVRCGGSEMEVQPYRAKAAVLAPVKKAFLRSGGRKSAPISCAIPHEKWSRLTSAATF
jgi:hypothetical protein